MISNCCRIILHIRRAHYIHPSVPCPSLHWYVSMSACLIIHLSILLPTNLPTHLSIHPSIHPIHPIHPIPSHPTLPRPSIWWIDLSLTKQISIQKVEIHLILIFCIFCHYLPFSMGNVGNIVPPLSVLPVPYEKKFPCNIFCGRLFLSYNGPSGGICVTLTHYKLLI